MSPRVRNAVTESYELGYRIAEIAQEHGIPVERVKALLKAAKAGYHTPEEQHDAEELKRLRKAGL